MPIGTQIVDVRRCERLPRIDRAIADQERGLTRRSNRERVGVFDKVRLYAVATFEQHAQQIATARRFAGHGDRRAAQFPERFRADAHDRPHIASRADARPGQEREFARVKGPRKRADRAQVQTTVQ
jgi:hypothetical protein